MSAAAGKCCEPAPSATRKRGRWCSCWRPRPKWPAWPASRRCAWPANKFFQPLKERSMEDQQKADQAQSDGVGIKMLPRELVQAVLNADVTLLLTADKTIGTVDIKPIVPGAAYEPESNPAHLLMAVITSQLPDLLAMARGDITDAVRYQALRQFGQLGTTDKERFEKVNTALREYE